MGSCVVPSAFESKLGLLQLERSGDGLWTDPFPDDVSICT